MTVTTSRCLCLCLLLTCFASFAGGQVTTIGSCPRLHGVPNFSSRAYSGMWYEVERYDFVFEVSSACVRVVYNDNGNYDGSFPVEIMQYDKLFRRTWHNPGLTRYLSKDGSGDFVLDLLITQSPVPFTFKYPYLVLGTDYNSYTIKWSCTQVGPSNVQSLWILSRWPYMRPETRAEVYGILQKMGVTTHNLRKSDLSNCPENEYNPGFGGNHPGVGFGGNSFGGASATATATATATASASVTATATATATSSAAAATSSNGAINFNFI